MLIRDSLNPAQYPLRLVEDKDPKSPFLFTFKRAIGQVQDTRNENNRRYSTKVWDRQLDESSDFVRRMNDGLLLGQLGHPKDGEDFKLENTCIKVDRVYRESGDKNVYMDGGVLKSPQGYMVKLLKDAGVNLGTSTRGDGNSTISDEDKVEDIDENSYVCYGWDVVGDPGFSQARLKTESLKKFTESILPRSSQTEMKEYESMAQSFGWKELTEAINQYKEMLSMEETLKQLTSALTGFTESLKKAPLPEKKGPDQNAVKLAEATRKLEAFKKVVDKIRAEMRSTNGYPSIREELTAAKKIIEKLHSDNKVLLGRVVESRKNTLALAKYVYETVIPARPTAATKVDELLALKTTKEIDEAASKFELKKKDESLPPKGAGNSGTPGKDEGHEISEGDIVSRIEANMALVEDRISSSGAPRSVRG